MEAFVFPELLRLLIEKGVRGCQNYTPRDRFRDEFHGGRADGAVGPSVENATLWGAGVVVAGCDEPEMSSRR